MEQSNPWIKRFERERAARKESEKLLEDKSMELFTLNKSLEKMVEERTKKLEQALVEAKEAQKAKDIFFSSMSHELRTPLNAIIGFSQILSLQPNLEDKIKLFIDKINLSGKNLLSLVNTILNFSKIESGKMELNLQETNIKEFIHESIVLIETQAAEKNITISLDLQDISASIDKQLLTQAILNIFSNAVKFTHIDGKISIEIKQLEKGFFIKICDDGVGIDAKDQEKLFKPFSQVKNEYQAKVNGIGLGLYLTKKIIELHGGKLELKSELNKGSCFTIFI